jgi:hypothetical protein
MALSNIKDKFITYFTFTIRGLCCNFYPWIPEHHELYKQIVLNIGLTRDSYCLNVFSKYLPWTLEI